MKTKLDQHIRTQNPILKNGVFPSNLPFTLNLDRLEFSFTPFNKSVPLYATIASFPKKGDFICANENITLKLIKRNKEFTGYRYIYQIYYKKEKVALLGTEYHQVASNIDVNTKLKFEKKIFYTKPRNFWLESFHSIVGALPIWFHGIHYLEIALDANREFRSHIGHLYNYSTKNENCIPEHRVYKPKSKALISTSNNGKTICIGHKSEKQIAIYDKKKEIKDKGTEYILSYFQENGLDIGSPIHRVEVRLGKALSKYNIHLEDLTKVDFLFSLFKQELLENLRYSDLARYTYKNRTKCFEVLDVLPLEMLTAPQEVTLDKKQKNIEQKPSGNYLQPSFVKTLVHQYLSEGGDAYKEAIKDVIVKDKVKYGYQTIARYIDEFCPENIDEDFFSQRISNLLSTDKYVEGLVNQYKDEEKSNQNNKPNDMNIQLLISVNQELKKNLEELAKSKKTNKSKLVRELIQEAYLRELQNS